MLNEKLFVKVNPQYTSQICNQCGYRDKNNRKTQSKFKCLQCHHEINADINASENIEQRCNILFQLLFIRLGLWLYTLVQQLFLNG